MGVVCLDSTAVVPPQRPQVQERQPGHVQDDAQGVQPVPALPLSVHTVDE